MDSFPSDTSATAQGGQTSRLAWRVKQRVGSVLSGILTGWRQETQPEVRFDAGRLKWLPGDQCPTA